MIGSLMRLRVPHSEGVTANASVAAMRVIICLPCGIICGIERLSSHRPFKNAFVQRRSWRAKTVARSSRRTPSYNGGHDNDGRAAHA